jgi:hypothetical protein
VARAERAGARAAEGAEEARMLRRVPGAAKVGMNALERHASITSRLREHLQQAIKQAKLTSAQARDIMKNGRASTIGAHRLTLVSRNLCRMTGCCAAKLRSRLATCRRDRVLLT